MYFHVSDTISLLSDRLPDFFSDLHAHPELAFEEYRTTERIKEQLTLEGIEILDIGAKTGVIARISAEHPIKPAVALRADIDAIPQFEKTERPDRSTIDGLMHGCGHDIHTTSLLGAGILLHRNRDKLNSDVYLVFQPAEEKLKGASYLIDSCHLFDHIHPRCMFGLHNYPESPIGTVCVKENALMSFKDSFYVKYTGKVAHSSMPQKNIDPIVAIAAFVQSAQTIISRNVGPLESAVLTFYQLHAGDKSSMSAPDAWASGNIRTLDSEVRSRILTRLQELAEFTAKAYNCQCTFQTDLITPGIINSREMTSIARVAAAETVGEDNVVTPPVNLASEDFSRYGEAVPSFFYFLGSGDPSRPVRSWHNECFYPARDTYYYGAALLANSVMAANNQ